MHLLLRLLRGIALFPLVQCFLLGHLRIQIKTTNAMIAYCFAEVPGYSAIGSYTGNGLADGPFVYTGFSPAFVIM
jgi:hypothetical protein